MTAKKKRKKQKKFNVDSDFIVVELRGTKNITKMAKVDREFLRQ